MTYTKFQVTLSSVNDVDINFDIGSDATLFATSDILTNFGFSRIKLHCGLSGWVYRLFIAPDGSYVVLGTGSYDTSYNNGDKPLDFVAQICPCCFDNELRRRIRNYIRRRRSTFMYKFLSSADYIALAVICDIEKCDIADALDQYTYSAWPESYYPGLSPVD